MSREYKYDVALSFAGEDRAIVEEVARILKSHGISVFYDKYEEVDLWGKDLSEHLDEVYRKKARYCVIFISKYYAEKAWPRHERRSALARAMEERGEYILPVRLDNTEIPGIRPTIGYLDIERYPPARLAEAILKKCSVGMPEWRALGFSAPLIIDKIPPLYSLHFFSERMAQAFPGKRGLVEIRDSEAIKGSLDTVLKRPLCVAERDGEGLCTPIWWWRGIRNLYIFRYKFVKEHGYFLINNDELNITKLVAHRSSAEDMEFVYIETSAVNPSGIYTFTNSKLAEMVTEFGFAWEELGYYKGRYISRAEYDDGYAKINGEIVYLGGEADLRRRFLTPYNMLIAPFDSRINNNSIDFKITELLNGVLTGVCTLEDIIELLRRSPKGKTR